MKRRTFPVVENWLLQASTNGCLQKCLSSARTEKKLVIAKAKPYLHQTSNLLNNVKLIFDTKMENKSWYQVHLKGQKQLLIQQHTSTSQFNSILHTALDGTHNYNFH
jgi:hypothetical protein